MAYATEIGTKYEQGRDTATIAALVRDDIKQAVRSGALPKATYSVRTSRYSMGSSISVRIKNVAGDFRMYNAERLRADREHRHVPGLCWMSDAGMDLTNKIEAIMAQYNRTTKEPQSDYYDCKFHAHVDFCSDYSNACRTREVAEMEAAMAAEKPSEQTAEVVAWLESLAPVPASNDLPETGSAEDLRLEALAASERAELRADRAAGLCALASGFAEGDWA